MLSSEFVSENSVLCCKLCGGIGLQELCSKDKHVSGVLHEDARRLCKVFRVPKKQTVFADVLDYPLFESKWA